MAANSLPIKVVVVGDSGVGKSQLIITWIHKEYVKVQSIGALGALSNRKVVVGGDQYDVAISDTYGMDNYEGIRSLFYLDTDCFLLCYDKSNRDSFDNVFLKWVPELRRYSKTTPIVLIGTKSDYQRADLVTTNEGIEMKKKIGAYAFVECSAKNKENLDKVIEAAVRAADDFTERYTADKCKCLLRNRTRQNKNLTQYSRDRQKIKENQCRVH